MPGFSDLKNMYKLQKDAKRMKKELKNIHVEAEASGVHVTVNAEQEILSITIDEHVERMQIPALLKDALNRAMKKAQMIAAEKMQSIMGSMGLPGQG